MKAALAILPVLAICLLCVTFSQGKPLTRTQELRCQCIKTESRQMHTRQFLNLELIPNGPHCKHLEVIATLKNGQEVCLEPAAPWVKKIIERLLDASQKNTPSTK
ncbi:interleukin-8-like [Hyperolius riggenbachi]|uniref:interleukin-8-like n=1 Tax=Hyperolius riggenbachi TaxID=752182 RepID=UPI0035A2C700